MKNSAIMRVVFALLALTLFATACGSDAADVVGNAADTVADTTGDVSDGVTGDEAEPAEEEVTEEATEEVTEEEVTEEVVEDDSTDVELTQDGGSLLGAIQSRGTLNCGVSTSAVAFSELQADGSRTGFDADYCRVVAAAILGDSEAVNFVALSAAERFTAVQTGDVDLLMRNTTWTQSRDTDVGMDFGPTTYYDGQQFMGRASDGFTADSTVEEIDGAIVCTNAGTTTEKNVGDAAGVLGITVDLQGFDDFDQVTDNFIAGACDVITTDGSGLVGRKAQQQPAGEEWVIFPSTPISKEPLGPTYGQNDSAFADVVNWSVYATIIADEYGIGSADVDCADPDATGIPEVGRLMGGEGELQTAMGLSADAFCNAISQVGNYSEIYDANLVPVGLKREGSANAGWLDGGLIYAPPAR